MRSPFAIFRKHQKLLTVVLTGLAMFAFVILGAVNDPSNMPPALIVIFVACMFGGIGWLLGIRSKKASEFGFVGLILGVLVSIGGMMAVGEPLRVKADTGNLNRREFASLQQQRNAANYFVNQAVNFARQNAGDAYIQPPAPFGFHPDPDRDVVICELLRREANEMGIVISDEMVTDYIDAVTQKKLGPAGFKEIRNAMNLSESDVYNILRNEIQARLTAQYLYGGTALPPETYWDFYNQLNVRESLGIVPVAVKDFVDKTSQPGDSELQQLFDTYRDNFPNVSADNRLEEGRPGFRQPRKVRLAYVEAAFDEVEKTVESPTDEEIQAFYDEHYKTIPADEFDADSNSSSNDSPDAGDGSSANAAGPALPAPDADGPDDDASEEDAEELPTGRIDGEDLPSAEEEQTSEPGGSEEGAIFTLPTQTQLVAYLKDEDATEDTEDEDTSDNSAETTTSDGEDETATPDTSGGSSSSDGPPPPPLPEPSNGDSPAPGMPSVRELDDDLRAEIRDQILRQRTGDKMQEVMDGVIDTMRDLEFRINNLPEDDDYLTREQALEELRAYAAKQGLTYTRTPLLSARELLDSEEYPIGTAVDQLFSDPFNPRPSTNVVQQAFESEAREVYRSRSVVQPETDSRFAYWKIEDQAEFVPQSLTDPGIREQVVATWRMQKAREKAQARATELASMAEGTDKPLSEVFASETVTGDAESPAISVLHPPRFSWMSKADPRMSPNPWSLPPPERTQLRTIPGRIGDSFMQKVFDDLREGDVGVAHSIDKDYLYVVKVDERSFGRAPDWQAFRQQFMKEPLFAQYYASDYPKLAQSTYQQYQTDWSEALFKKHGVEMIESKEEPPRDEQPPGPPPSSFY